MVKKLDYKEHCLKKLTIFNPLVVKENGKVELEITFDETPKHSVRVDDFSID